MNFLASALGLPQRPGHVRPVLILQPHVAWDSPLPRGSAASLHVLMQYLILILSIDQITDYRAFIYVVFSDRSVL